MSRTTSGRLLQKPPKLLRSAGEESLVFSEASTIAKCLGDYVYQSSKVWGELKRKFSPAVTHHELISVARIIASIIPINPISRNEKRSFPILIRWYETNWTAIQTVIGSIQLLDKHMIPINMEMQKAMKQLGLI